MSLATGSFDNAVIADYAINHYPNGSYGGQCRSFVNDVVKASTGVSIAYGAPNQYFKAFEDNGAFRVTNVSDLRKGDIVQSGETEADPHLHTFIIIGLVSGTTFDVIDSNHNLDEKVARYNRTVSLSDSVRAYRLGVVSAGVDSRIGFLSGGNLYVKQGPLNAGWSPLAQGVKSFEMSSNRIGILQDGTLSVKEGGLSNGWIQVGTGISSFHINDNAVYALFGTNLYVKQGSLDSGWQLILNPVLDFQVSASGHVAARLTNGSLVVQWGPVGSGWQQVATGNGQYFITDTALAALFGTNLYVKQGGVTAAWGLVLNSTTSFTISPNNHIAAVLSNGHLVVQWGPVGTGWKDVATGFSSYGITDNRLGAVFGGNLSIKEGGPSVGWSPIASSVNSFGLS
jgi:hypothetical protein